MDGYHTELYAEEDYRLASVQPKSKVGGCAHLVYCV